MRRILMLTTGGTIASVQSPDGLVPGLTSEQLRSYLPQIGADIDIDIEELFHIDSTDMTAAHWLKIVDAVKENYSSYDGFVICHGTDTMAYTAAVLSYMIQNSAKPIVLTGAQKPIGFEITDAKANLQDSIIYAADPLSKGVQVVFAGNVIAGTRARKVRSMSFSAFNSINLAGRTVFYDRINPKVFLLKLTPSMSPKLIPEIFRIYDGIVIESFGAGGIPQSIKQTLFDELSKYSPEEKVLAMTTQVPLEGSHLDSYEVGRRIAGSFEILEGRDMTLEAITAKLMWILADRDQSWDEIQRRFYKPVAKDTLIKQK